MEKRGILKKMGANEEENVVNFYVCVQQCSESDRENTGAKKTRAV